MDLSKSSRARWLQIGLGVFSLGMAVGAALLVLGRTGDRRQRLAREAEAPAAPGTIPAERHKNVGTVAAR